MPERQDKIITYCCAFFLPFLLGALAFAGIGAYPFGDKSLLIADMNIEYIDYLAQLNETVRASGSMFRSWNMGMGLNMFGLIAFYIASPFNIIAIIMPLSMITEAVYIITILKLGLAGFLFAVYAREIFFAAGRVFHVVLAVAYALCAYNIVYSSNFMWLDGAAFLPLVLLGTERLLCENKCRLFVFALIYVFFTSYYIGYMIGAFSFLYLAARHFAGRNGLRAFARRLPRFFGSAALAAGCCAFLLLPAFLNLRDGQSQLWQIPFSVELRYPFVRLAAKLLPGSFDTLTDAALPQIYCTVLGVSLCFLFFVTKAVPLREKVVYGTLAGFLLLSFSCGFLDLAWHAFEDPTWYPARYSFVFSFLVLHLALRCASLRKRIKRGEILAAAGLCALLFLEVGINRFRFIETKHAIIGILLIVLYALILVFCNSGRRAWAALLVVLACFESFGSSLFALHGMDALLGYRSRSAYREFMQSYGDAVAAVQELGTGVYRTEILGQRSANGGMALGYNGISHYSTTTDQALNTFLRDLGYNRGTINELRFAAATPLTNGLLGIKYVLSRQNLGEGYIFSGISGDIAVYENRAAWPLAFWAPAAAAEFKPAGAGKSGPFRLQNAWLTALTGSSATAFIPLRTVAETLENVEKIDYGDHIAYTREIKKQQAAVTFTIENRTGNSAYAFFPVWDDRFSTSEIYVDGMLRGRDLAYRNNTIISLGSAETVTLRIVLGGDRIRITNAYFATLDLAAAHSAALAATSRQMRITAFYDDYVAGSITAPETGVLATTFPYDAGWHITVDGQRTPLLRHASVFLAVPLEAGEHKIEMRYVAPGFLPGLAVSVICVVGVLLWQLHKKTRRLKGGAASGTHSID